MNAKTLALGTALLAIAFALPQHAAADTNCVDLGNRIRACGTVSVEPIGSSATGEGTATASVTWVLSLHTSSPTCGTSTSSTGPAFVGALRSCSAGCAFATLTANGVVVDSHGLC